MPNTKFDAKSFNAEAFKYKVGIVPISRITSTHKAVSQILPECAELFDSVKLYDTTDGGILIAVGGNGQKLTAIKGKEDLFQAFLDKAFE